MAETQKPKSPAKRKPATATKKTTVKKTTTKTASPPKAQPVKTASSAVSNPILRPAPKKKISSSGLAFLVLIIGLIIAVVVYATVWFGSAKELEGLIAKNFSQKIATKEMEMEIGFKDSSVSGFPFELNANIDGLWVGLKKGDIHARRDFKGSVQIGAPLFANMLHVTLPTAMTAEVKRGAEIASLAATIQENPVIVLNLRDTLYKLLIQQPKLDSLQDISAVAKDLSLQVPSFKIVEAKKGEVLSIEKGSFAMKFDPLPDANPKITFVDGSLSGVTISQALYDFYPLFVADGLSGKAGLVDFLKQKNKETGKVNYAISLRHEGPNNFFDGSGLFSSRLTITKLDISNQQFSVSMDGDLYFEQAEYYFPYGQFRIGFTNIEKFVDHYLAWVELSLDGHLAMVTQGKAVGSPNMDATDKQEVISFLKQLGNLDDKGNYRIEMVKDVRTPLMFGTKNMTEVSTLFSGLQGKLVTKWEKAFQEIAPAAKGKTK